MADDERADEIVEQLMRRTLLRELSRVVETGGRAATQAERIVRALVERAVKSDDAAVREVFDRSDGRPPARAAAPAAGPRPRIVQWRPSTSTISNEDSSSPSTSGGSDSPAS
ncbi:MAG TPA: hypothetical protein VGF60_10160 [Xanthobacteraceae bacterium]|jgi:hypothetical protein